MMRSRGRMMMSRRTMLSSLQPRRQRKKAKKAVKKAVKKAKKAKKKVSKIAKGKMSKSMVLRGSKEKTSSGLTAKDLTKNKYGKVVSKKASAKAKKSPWIAAVAAARKALNIKGFQAIKKGTPLYTKAKSLYKPKEEDEEEQEQEQEEDEQDDESEDDIELLAAKKAAKKAVKKAK